MNRSTGCALCGVLATLVLTPWASAGFVIDFEGFANGMEIGGGERTAECFSRTRDCSR